jgi:hypothetical protein
VSDADREFLEKAIRVLERLAELSLKHHQPLLASLVDIAKAEAADSIRAQAETGQRLSAFKMAGEFGRVGPELSREAAKRRSRRG